MPGEFELIRRYFAEATDLRADVPLGIGDDCALLRPPIGLVLAMTCDTLVSGIHFFPDVPADRLGHKALAVSLSDLAAMGAEPCWFSLALTLPAVDSAWLDAFSTGLAGLAKSHGVSLIGGDTTRGPLSITIHAIGTLPESAALRRSGAKPGDVIYVSGDLGAAGLALKQRTESDFTVSPQTLARLELPSPRVALGLALRGIASACIDISDGLAADLGHLLTASAVGGHVEIGQLPVNPEVDAYIRATDDWSLPLNAGDDYELCFTSPAEHAARIGETAQRLNCPITPIGVIETAAGLRLTREGSAMNLRRSGFQHF